MGLEVKERSIVIPGEVLATGMDYLPASGTFREGDNIIATQLGIVNVSGRLVKLIPLSGRYIPKKGDVIIGKIADMGFSGWRVEIGWAFEANLSMKDGSSDFIEKKADLSHLFGMLKGKVKMSGQEFKDLAREGWN